ncbi:MAG: SPFH domain-containing protein [Dehalococcoidia bacterium]
MTANESNPRGVREVVSDRPGTAMPGIIGVIVTLGFLAGAAALFWLAVVEESAVLAIAGGVPAVLGLVWLGGFLVIQPNQAVVLIVLGSYQGTLTQAGFWWANPLSAIERRTLSLRARNFNSHTSKVNDANGNPINIAAVVVWQVVDSARATFDVDDYEDFVVVQSETAVRHLARSYPYDSYGEGPGDENELTLIGDAEEIAATLQQELQDRLDTAGVRVIEARLTDLAYAPEIAEAMLRRQQAGAIVAARRRIVDGAVGMVRMALEEIEAGHIVELDDERKATMVSNLLTVLTSDHPTSPVVNVGTLSR